MSGWFPFYMAWAIAVLVCWGLGWRDWRLFPVGAVCVGVMVVVRLHK